MVTSAGQAQPPGNTLTVSQLNRDAKNLLESHFETVHVEGEIGDFTAASSGHWYFTLKDASAQIRCAMFRGANQRVKLRPAKGDSVRVSGRISLYENRGEFQLIAQKMEAAGDGALQLAFEALKQRLKAEGLFEPDRKQSLPNFARRLGVVTSATGAALQDILSVCARRSPLTEIVVFPVPVQGNEAAPAIVDAITQANQMGEALGIDALIVGRGGGSLEDLWAFNEEVVARAIAESSLPIVSAVGHEVDFTIADFVADQRAATPSAAAELLTIDQEAWMQQLDRAHLTLSGSMRRKLKNHHQTLNQWRKRLRHPRHHLTRSREQIARQRRQLVAQMNQRLRVNRTALANQQQRLSAHAPHRAIARTREQLGQQRGRLGRAIRQQLDTASQALTLKQRLLETLGPTNTLARGYAIVLDGNGRVLREAENTAVGDAVQVRLQQGSLSANVTAIDPDS